MRTLPRPPKLPASRRAASLSRAAVAGARSARTLYRLAARRLQDAPLADPPGFLALALEGRCNSGCAGVRPRVGGGPGFSAARRGGGRRPVIAPLKRTQFSIVGGWGGGD